MLLFFKALVSLNIYNLNTHTRNYLFFNYQTSSVFSYGYVRDFLPPNLSKRDFFMYENEDLSEIFFYKVALDAYRLIENRCYMIEKDKDITVNNFTLPVNEFCKIIEINPKFSIGKLDDNNQNIEVENIENYSQVVWDHFIMNSVIYNKKLFITYVRRILSESIDTLEYAFINYPLLYFYNSVENIKNVFSILLEKISDIDSIDYNIIYNSLKFLCDNENENMVMQRYHLLKGREITNESKDFYFSCLLTDIFNILKYFSNQHEYKFEILNFVEYKYILYGQFYIGIEIGLKIKTVKQDFEKKPAIYMYDNNNQEITNFFNIDCGNKFFIMLNKVWCLNNNLNRIRIIIHTDAKIYESKYINIKKHVFD